ncbi:nitrate- and nitrite sensing domain-containing protein [Streptomyces sp. NBC_01477]|uniref:nitrate- and nitrite sensing domain-containing protein n=1 Tax=Streptomyces sp. NBC_01477 TaxID=2976015 RepID=UPI002E335362|nr:nitrate- and nitrite sensing domain-containing protein [Streptomyces sp. NBC_01477]
MPGTRDRRTRHRSVPRRSLRSSFVLPFVVPAVCLCGLWGYTADGLVSRQIDLHAAADRTSSVARPAQDVVSRLQTERRLTAVWQAGGSSSARKDLDTARTKTDAAVQKYRKASGLNSSGLQSWSKSLGDALVFLPERRSAIDGHSLSSTDAFQFFTDTVSNGIGLVSAASRSDDGRLVHGATATASVAQITEMLSREDAVLSAALPAHQLSATARGQFGEYLAIQRQLRTDLTIGDLPGGAATSAARIADNAQSNTVSRIEDAVATGQGTALPQLAAEWPTAADALTADLQGLGSDSLADLADIASDGANDQLIAVLIGTGATLAALAAGVLLALRSRRSTLRRLSDLQARTNELSGVWLPRLLARIESGERVPRPSLAPQSHQATDEIERIAGAIDQLGRVAADTVIRQSLGREGTEKVFAQLIRRTQILIHRLISLLDDLERKHEDSDLLKDIFKVDHLATRVRRHAESLVILSGAAPSRQMTAPVSIIDVMRSAVAETESYTRVKVKNMPADRQLALAGRAVADVTHLLAELIENGTSFSPPDTQVFVSASKVGKGLVVHIEDHGLGMPQELLDHANELLANPPRLDMTALSEDPRLGHFVVARLAERHRIKVELRDSVYGGTLVVVLLPAALLEEVDSPVLDQLRSAAGASAVSTAAGEGPRNLVSEAPRPAAPALDSGVLVAADRGPAAGTGGGAAGGGAGLRSGNAGVIMPDGGRVIPQNEAHPLTHTRVPDYSGFPEYGGPGLLPAASDQPASPAPGPSEWAPAQEHPAHYGTDSGGTGRPVSAASGGNPPAGYGMPTGNVPTGRTPTGNVPTGTMPTGNVPAQDAQHPLTTPQVLPQRTRGASLATQLRREAAYTQDRPDGSGGDNGVISPDASARAMIAIQQGLERARMSETDEPGATEGRPDSRSSGANQL